MRDSQHGGQSDRGSDGLTVLARSVVARLVARDGQPIRAVDDQMVASLVRALTAPDGRAMDDLRPELRRMRISDVDLVDVYFPAVARSLGCAWLDDTGSFAEVTLGVARMQAILRQVGREWTSNAAATPDSASVLMILPEGEQHSFGAMLMTSQLRRQGVSVRLEIGATAERLERLVTRQSFDCAMISAGCEEKLELCQKLVKALKNGTGGQLRVAVGGAVLARPVDVGTLTGADLACNDAGQVLHGLGVRLAPMMRVLG